MLLAAADAVYLLLVRPHWTCGAELLFVVHCMSISLQTGIVLVEPCCVVNVQVCYNTLPIYSMRDFA